MAKISIYGQKYTIVKDTSVIPDTYYYRGEFYQEPLEGMMHSGYVTYDDGSIIGVYTGGVKKLFVIIGIVAAVAVMAVGVAFLIPLLHKKTEPFSGTMMKTVSDHDNIINFNGIPQSNGVNLDIRFTNGDKPSTIQIVGDTCESLPVELKAGEQVSSIPIINKTKSTVGEATLVVTTNGNTYEYPIIVEMPFNDTLSNNSGDYLSNDDSPFKGESLILEK